MLRCTTQFRGCTEIGWPKPPAFVYDFVFPHCQDAFTRVICYASYSNSSVLKSIILICQSVLGWWCDQTLPNSHHQSPIGISNIDPSNCRTATVPENCLKFEICYIMVILVEIPHIFLVNDSADIMGFHGCYMIIYPLIFWETICLKILVPHYIKVTPTQIQPSATLSIINQRFCSKRSQLKYSNTHHRPPKTCKPPK